MSNIIITTERLNLETIKECHLDNLYSLLSNKKVQKFFPKTLDRLETKRFYDKIQNRYRSDGYCYWAVIRKSDRIFLGICGALKQEIDEKIETEIGYRLLDKYWDNGYGVEAARGCISYVKENLKFETVISLIIPQNTLSIKVAKKCGLSFEKETLFQELQHYVYRMQLKE